MARFVMLSGSKRWVRFKETASVRGGRGIVRGVIGGSSDW
jgi:hypothetical protein